MNLTKELMNGLIKAVGENNGRPDALWAVTAFRTNVYCLFRTLKLSTPNAAREKGVEPVGWRQEIANVLCSYAAILTTFPEEIKYGEGQVETPRASALDRSFEVAQGLQSDGDAWGSAQELVRLVATNPDSEHQKIDYAVLMGIALKIIELVGFDAADVCVECINAMTSKAA